MSDILIKSLLRLYYGRRAQYNILGAPSSLKPAIIIILLTECPLAKFLGFDCEAVGHFW